MSDLSETGPIEVNRPTKSRYGQRRCIAHKKNGERCKNAARLGGTVCGFHGGRAPAVIAKARERLALAADRMEPPDLPADDPAPATGPPGRELATLEDAAADAVAVNRRAKVGRMRRVR